MKHIRRTLGLMLSALLLLTTFAPNAATQAQDPEAAVTVAGSGLVSAILETAKTAYMAKHPDAQIDIQVTGTAGGFEKLCEGVLDVAMAYGPISEAQVAACLNKVEFVELLLGYDAVSVVVNSASPVTCLSIDQLNRLLSPSAAGVNDWSAIDPEIGEIAITAIYGPPADPDLPVQFLLDRVIAGEGLRDDIQAVESAAEIADKVDDEPDSVGIMALADYRKVTGKRIRPVQIRDGEACIEPSTPNLDEVRYPPAESLYLYVNAASLERQPVMDFLSYLLSAEGRQAVTGSNYVLASAVLYDRGQGYLNSRRTGRTFSLIQSVNIPANTAGAVNVGGSPLAYGLLNTINNTFTPRYTQISFNAAPFGNDAGYRRLCADQVDIIGTTRLPTEDEAQVCQDAGLQTLTLRLGVESLVVVVNEENTFASCLSLDNLARIFSNRYQSKTWADVAQGFPALDLLVLLPREGSAETDFLLTRLIRDEVAPVPRLDATRNDDALYRAAAVQNVEGGVTFLTYSEFTRSTAKVKALAVEGGEGCVEPTRENILSGKYPIAVPLYAVVNVQSFARPEIRAYIWYLLGDDALAVVEREGIIGTDRAAFIATRDFALERFAQAEVPQPTPMADTTPDVTATPITDVEPTATPTATE